jgi:hypothetical protein
MKLVPIKKPLVNKLKAFFKVIKNYSAITSKLIVAEISLNKRTLAV